MSTAAIPAQQPRGVIRDFRRGRFYVALSAFMCLLVLVGFWPTYFGPLLRGVSSRPWVIQIHGVVFVGWMSLLVAQVVLAATGRTRAHRKLGTAGIAYGFLVLAMGLVVSFAAPLIHLKAGDWDMNRAASFLLIPLGDMALFGTLFVLAVIYRNQPDIHKRFIVASTVALLFAAVGRMEFLNSLFLTFLVWLSPLLAGMGYDLLKRRRIHRTYFVSLAMLLVGFSRVFVYQTEPWMRIGRAILTAIR
jgi:hypothetical protein